MNISKLISVTVKNEKVQEFNINRTIGNKTVVYNDLNYNILNSEQIFNIRLVNTDELTHLKTVIGTNKLWFNAHNNAIKISVDC